MTKKYRILQKKITVYIFIYIVYNREKSVISVIFSTDPPYHWFISMTVFFRPVTSVNKVRKTVTFHKKPSFSCFVVKN